MKLMEFVPGNFEKRNLYWRAIRAVNLKKDKYSNEAYENLRALCLAIWDAESVEDAEDICVKIEQTV
jgi:hypothetical protein